MRFAYCIYRNNVNSTLFLIYFIIKNEENDVTVGLLARERIRTNRRAITMIVRLSVSVSGTGVHCDQTVHVSADLTLTSKRVHLLPAVFFQFHVQETKRGVAWKMQTRRDISRTVEDRG